MEEVLESLRRERNGDLNELKQKVLFIQKEQERVLKSGF